MAAAAAPPPLRREMIGSAPVSELSHALMTVQAADGWEPRRMGTGLLGRITVYPNH